MQDKFQRRNGQLVGSLRVKAECAGVKMIEVPSHELRLTRHGIESGEYMRQESAERRIKLSQSGLSITWNEQAALKLLWLDVR